MFKLSTLCCKTFIYDLPLPLASGLLEMPPPWLEVLSFFAK